MATDRCGGASVAGRRHPQSGSVAPVDGSPQLDWYVAADDRWHDPGDRCRPCGIVASTARPCSRPRCGCRAATRSNASGRSPTTVAARSVDVHNDSSLPIAVVITCSARAHEPPRPAQRADRGHRRATGLPVPAACRPPGLRDRRAGPRGHGRRPAAGPPARRGGRRPRVGRAWPQRASRLDAPRHGGGRRRRGGALRARARWARRPGRRRPSASWSASAELVRLGELADGAPVAGGAGRGGGRRTSRRRSPGGRPTPRSPRRRSLSPPPVSAVPCPTSARILAGRPSSPVPADGATGPLDRGGGGTAAAARRHAVPRRHPGRVAGGRRSRPTAWSPDRPRRCRSPSAGTAPTPPCCGRSTATRSCSRLRRSIRHGPPARRRARRCGGRRPPSLGAVTATTDDSMPDVHDQAPLRLTEWTSCGGCAAKWGASLLASLVGDFPPPPIRICWSGWRPSTTPRCTGSTTTRRWCRRPTSSRRSSTTPPTSGRSPPPTPAATSSRWAAGSVGVNIAAFPEHFPRRRSSPSSTPRRSSPRPGEPSPEVTRSATRNPSSGWRCRASCTPTESSARPGPARRRARALQAARHRPRPRRRHSATRRQRSPACGP